MNAWWLLFFFSLLFREKSETCKNTCYYINWWTDKLTRITKNALDKSLCFFVSAHFLLFERCNVHRNVFFNTRSLNSIFNHFHLYPFVSNFYQLYIGLYTIQRFTGKISKNEISKMQNLENAKPQEKYAITQRIFNWLLPKIWIHTIY